MSSNVLYIGPGIYMQEEYAIRKAGEQAKRLGKKAFILGGKTALSVALGDLGDSLAKAGIEYETAVFSGFCTMEQIGAYSEKFKASGADFIIGVGGGRAVDTAKGVTFSTDAPIMVIPTSVATCASFATVVILYDDKGDPIPDSAYMTKPIDITLVDTDIIARKCPPRMLATGVADSLAKLVEITFLRRVEPKWAEIFLAGYAWQMAENIWNMHMEKGLKACGDAEEKLVTKDLEDVVATCLMLTGLSSLWGNGCRQIAFAHNLYYAMCIYCKEQQAQYMHGELVAMGLPIQLMINGAPQAEIDALISYLKSIHVPVYPADVGLVPNEELCEKILAFCNMKMSYLGEKDREIMRERLYTFWMHGENRFN